MWKIKNETNKKALDIFRKEFIEPIFTEIFHYKKLLFKYNNLLDYMKSNDIIYPKKKDLFLTALKRTKDKVRLHEHFENFCANDEFYMFYQYFIYLIQNLSLDRKIYNIKNYVVDDNLKKVFIEFYYEKFIKDSTIWRMIDQNYSDFDRKVFHENFCEENELTVCPYCDIDTLNNIGNREIEHYMPKSKYSFVSMHPYNLISSCSSCNKYEGKKTNYYMPIESPYTIQYGDLIKFNIDNTNKIVMLTAQGIDYIDNYLKLLNLNIRYQNNNIYETIDGRAKSLFAIYLDSEQKGDKIDQILFNRYLNDKKEPLTFALKSLYENFDAYNAYKKNR